MLTRTNISTTLVANELQTSSHDVGTLCTHKNINMWSKWKPINVNATTLTDLILIDNNYGIIAPEPDTSIERAMTRAWAYNRPTGGANSPYRLGDFRGYDHTAPPPVSTQEDVDWYIAVLPTLTLELTKGALSAAGILVNDLKVLDDYYLALCVFRNGYWQYVSGTVAGVGGSITIDASDFPTSTSVTTYEACLMATTDPGHDINTGENLAQWLPLPNSDGTPFKFNLTIRTVSPLQTATLTGVQSQADYSDASWSWQSADNYIGADPTGLQIDKYYSVGRTWTLQMRLHIENPTDQDYQFTTNNLRMVMSRNFLVNQEVTVVPIIFDANTHLELDSFTIYGNGGIDIGISTPYLALRFNTLGVVTGDDLSATQLIKVSFSITQNNREIFNRSIRLSNIVMIG